MRARELVMVVRKYLGGTVRIHHRMPVRRGRSLGHEVILLYFCQ